MKDGNWIALDKCLAHYLPRKRPYTILEAMFSYSKDIDEGKENSINGYSRIWSWSRCKVRRFVDDLKTVTRHAPDRDETGMRQEVRIINGKLEDIKDSDKTPARHGQDTGKTTTINPNPNPKENIPYDEILSDLNQKGGYKYRPGKVVNAFINGRFAEGYTAEDFFHVHTVMIAKWKDDEKMSQYLRPSTLYRPSHFQEYLNTKQIVNTCAIEEWQ
jgi:uncharacterized phage protein (TIGR02220 family)